MEHIIFHEMMSHLDSNQVLVNYQHGFRRKLSCETQLICTVEEIACSLDKGEETDLIIMDFSKSFNSVPHQRLLIKNSLLWHMWYSYHLANTMAYVSKPDSCR